MIAARGGATGAAPRTLVNYRRTGSASTKTSTFSG
jgi:hypothetical protein